MNIKIIALIICLLIISTVVIAGVVLIDTPSDENITGNSSTEVVKEYLDGYEIAGNINIPKTNINLPVLSECTTDSLNVSVAVMYGNGLNNIGNTVIYGHTYYNENKDKFFSNNNKLSVGDIFYITTQGNNKIAYEIYDIKKLKSNDVSYYERDTQGKIEVTLVTTNNDSTYNRLVIFAREKSMVFI